MTCRKLSNKYDHLQGAIYYVSIGKVRVWKKSFKSVLHVFLLDVQANFFHHNFLWPGLSISILL